MGTHMLITFIILIVATALFIHGKLRPDVVAIGSLLTLVITGIITPTEALAGFSNSVVVMIAGLFIVGAGIFNTGLAKQIGNRLLRLGNNSETRLFLIILVTVGFFSAFMSNTGTVAVLLPVVVSMALNLKISPAKFLMPLAFASSLGGVLTLIGTPPNLVVSNVLVENGFEQMSFFQFTPVGLVALFFGILFMSTIGKRLLPNNTGVESSNNTAFSPNELAGFYKIYHSLHLVRVRETSPIVGQTLQAIDITMKYSITIVSIEREAGEGLTLIQNHKQIISKANTIVQANDLLLLFGSLREVNSLIEHNGLKKLESQTENDRKQRFLPKQFGISEVLITPQSNYKNKTIRELHFRKRLKCTVLAIHRNGTYIQKDVAKERLQTGDALLVHGTWERIEFLAEMTSDVVVVGRVSEAMASAAATGKAPIAGSIMLFMLFLMTFEIMNPEIAVLLSAFLMIITGCLRSSGEAYQKINWESVLLIAGMLPMATALEKTGGVQLISDSLLGVLGNYGPYAVLAGFYLLTMLLSQFISNTATAVIFAPIAISAALGLEVSPYPFVITVAIAASMAFSTPVASPTNALVMNAGGYVFRDFVKVGVPLQIFLAIIMIPVIPLFFPF